MAEDARTCDRCGESGPLVQLTQLEGDTMKTLHLCAECASEQGLELAAEGGNVPLADFLGQLGVGVGSGPARGVCPECGMSTAQLRQSGRLGCAQCYTHYQEHLRGLLRRLHGGTQHVGKQLLPARAEADLLSAQLQSLRRSLERAVAAEDFEYAAAVRDQVRELERQERAAEVERQERAAEQ